MKRICLCILIFFLVCCKHRFYRAPSDSMAETIKLGQTFLVTSTNKYERNDIVVFNYYGLDYSSIDEETGQFNKMHWEKRVSRLIAYSGDSVEINNGEVFVNGRHIALPGTAKVQFEILSQGPIEEFTETDQYDIRQTRGGDTTGYIAILSVDQAFEYQQRKPFIIRVKRVFPDVNITDTALVHATTTGKWTIDNYGPFKIPSPGQNILIDDDNFKFFHNIPGIKKGMNQINEKLYFVLGDNRYGSMDSRYIGVIPHTNMFGLVKMK